MHPCTTTRSQTLIQQPSAINEFLWSLCSLCHIFGHRATNTDAVQEKLHRWQALAVLAQVHVQGRGPRLARSDLARQLQATRRNVAVVNCRTLLAAACNDMPARNVAQKARLTLGERLRSSAGHEVLHVKPNALQRVFYSEAHFPVRCERHNRDRFGLARPLARTLFTNFMVKEIFSGVLDFDLPLRDFFRVEKLKVNTVPI